MRGEGEYAEQIRALFEASCAKLGLNRERVKLSTAAWRRPEGGDQSQPQLNLF
jgi:hypothetical protein